MYWAYFPAMRPQHSSDSPAGSDLEVTRLEETQVYVPGTHPKQITQSIKDLLTQPLHFIPKPKGMKHRGLMEPVMVNGDQLRGGENEIYVYVDGKGNPGDIVKISHETVEPDIIQPQIDEHRAFVRYFTEEHPDVLIVPRERSFVDGTRHLVTVQKPVPEFLDPHTPIRGGYAEFHNPDPQTYEYASRAGVSQDPRAPFDKDALLQAQQCPELNEVFDILRTQRSARKRVRAALEHLVIFSDMYGSDLDLQGGDNIGLCRDEKGEWKVATVDALMGRSGMKILSRRGLDLATENFHSLQRCHKISLLNGMNAARTINGILAYTGSAKRYDLLPEHLRHRPRGMVRRALDFILRRTPHEPKRIPYRALLEELAKYKDEALQDQIPTRPAPAEPPAASTNNNAAARASADTADDSLPLRRTVLQEPHS